MKTHLSSVVVAQDQDVVLARQQAKQAARLLGFDAQDQVRLAIAVSELARGCLPHRVRGIIEFWLEDGPAAQFLILIRQDRISTDAETLSTCSESDAVIAARRVVDDLTITQEGPTLMITISKRLPRPTTLSPSQYQRQLAGDLRALKSQDLVQQVVETQNLELLQAYAELRANQAELVELNRELEETNRGVVALYAELEEKAESLRRAAEQKARFYSGMSHELRTPLTSILSLAGMLLARIDGDLTAGQEKQVSLIQQSAQSLLEWVNDLLDLAKVDAGRMKVRPCRFHANELLTGLRGIMRPLLTRSEVTLVFEDASQVPELETDDGMLAQILRNFISNALKFTEQGEVRVRAEVMDDNSELVRFSVTDTGIGIAPADQKRIFEEFVQVDSPLQRKVKGTGLGLPLSQRLIELLGGSLKLTSEPGVGSEFSITIPRVYHEHAEAPQRKSEPPSPLPPPPDAPVSTSAKPKILLVDDDAASRYLLRQALAACSVGPGLEVVEAGSGSQGVELARRLQPRLIFLDLQMPDVDGFEVLKRLKSSASTARVPVAIYSGHALSEEESAALERQAIAVIGKPVGNEPLSRERLTAALVRAGLDHERGGEKATS